MEQHGTPPSPGLWRIAAAAHEVGMTPDAFADACDRGDIPIEVIRLGPRQFRYIRASELQAFLRHRNTDLI